MKKFILILYCLKLVTGDGTGGSGGESSQYLASDDRGNYAFSYAEEHATGGSFRREEKTGDSVSGSYGLHVGDGRTRIVKYVADRGGFRASISSNEPGLDVKAINQAADPATIPDPDPDKVFGRRLSLPQVQLSQYQHGSFDQTPSMQYDTQRLDWTKNAFNFDINSQKIFLNQMPFNHKTGHLKPHWYNLAADPMTIYSSGQQDSVNYNQDQVTHGQEVDQPPPQWYLLEPVYGNQGQQETVFDDREDGLINKRRGEFDDDTIVVPLTSVVGSIVPNSLNQPDDEEEERLQLELQRLKESGDRERKISERIRLRSESPKYKFGDRIIPLKKKR